MSWVTPGPESQPLSAAAFEMLLLCNLGSSWPLGIKERLKVPSVLISYVQ